MENFNEQAKWIRNQYLLIVLWLIIKAKNLFSCSKKAKHLNCLSSFVQVLHLSLCKPLSLLLPNQRGIQKEVFSCKMATILGLYFSLHLWKFTEVTRSFSHTEICISIRCLKYEVMICQYRCKKIAIEIDMCWQILYIYIYM